MVKMSDSEPPGDGIRVGSSPSGTGTNISYILYFHHRELRHLDNGRLAIEFNMCRSFVPS